MSSNLSGIVTEPHLSFQHAGLKIEWAKVLINQLHLVSQAYIKKKPWHIAVEPDYRTGNYGLRFGLDQPMPADIALLAGDIVGNLRASLDFAWMGLIRANNPSVTVKRTLPIADNRQGLIATIEKAPIEGAVSDAKGLLVDRIKSHRDFTDGGSQILIALNALSNWNKHNLVITAATVTALHNVSIGGLAIDMLEVSGGVVKVAAFPEKAKFEHDGNPTVQIVFGKHDLVENQAIIPTLIQFGEFCRQSLKSFCEVFPSEHNPKFP